MKSLKITVKNGESFWWNEWSKFKKNGMKRKQWQFNVISPEQINFDEISKDLSSSHPMAVVELDGENSKDMWVIIHSSIVDKDFLLHGSHGLFVGEVDIYGNLVVECFEESMIKTWTERVKGIKTAKWLEEDRNKGVVKVTLKEI